MAIRSALISFYDLRLSNTQKISHARLGELYQDLPALAEEKERRAKAKEVALVANRERIKQQMERIQVQRGQDLTKGK